MDTLLKAIATVEPGTPKTADPDLDAIFADTADYDMMGIDIHEVLPEVWALPPRPVGPPPLATTDNYIEVLSERWSDAFHNAYDMESVDEPANISLYKLKNFVKSHKDNGGASLHPGTGKCSGEVILISLLKRGSYNVPEIDWLCEKLREYLEWQRKTWQSKKETTAKKTNLIKFNRYNEVLKRNAKMTILEDN